MKKLTTIFISTAAIALAFVSCTKTGATGPAGATGATGATGPNLSGTLEGYVDLYDPYGELQSNASGVTITIPGKTGSAITASNGMFTWSNLTTGTYELDFALTGYDSTKIVSLGFAGGGIQYINGHIGMTQSPTYTLTSIALGTNTVNPAVTVTVTPALTDAKARKVICFLAKSASVSSAPSTYMGSVTISIPANAATGAGNIQVSQLYSMGFMDNDVLYMAVYPISVSTGASTYPDIATGKTVFKNIGSSVVTATVTVP